MAYNYIFYLPEVRNVYFECNVGLQYYRDCETLGGGYPSMENFVLHFGKTNGARFTTTCGIFWINGFLDSSAAAASGRAGMMYKL